VPQRFRTDVEPRRGLQLRADGEVVLRVRQGVSNAIPLARTRSRLTPGIKTSKLSYARMNAFGAQVSRVAGLISIESVGEIKPQSALLGLDPNAAALRVRSTLCFSARLGSLTFYGIIC